MESYPVSGEWATVPFLYLRDIHRWSKHDIRRSSDGNKLGYLPQRHLYKP
jgi:hypothetical protein